MPQPLSRWIKLAVFALFLGLPLAVGAQETSPQIPASTVQIGEYGGPPPLNQQEKSDFVNEFANLQKEANQLLKQLIEAKGAEELQATLKETVSAAGVCVNTFNQAPAKEQRGIMDDCRNQRLWDGMNEIRGKFIPPQEKKDFTNEFRNLQKEANQLLKDIAKAKGTEEWQAILKQTVSAAIDCVNRFNQAPTEEQRDVMDDCRSQNLWNDMNDIRQEFVPPREIKQVFQEIKNQQQELNRYKKQLAKVVGGSATLGMIENLLVQLETYKTNISQAVGRDQRDAMQDFRDAQIWEEINKIRAVVELPKEMKNIVRDLKIVQKNVKSASYQKALKFFEIDIEKLRTNLDAKQAVVDQINAFSNEGDVENAFLLLEEDIHQGWHPGDVRHFSDMMRETHQRMKGLKDSEIRDQIMFILSSIVDTFNQGDYREAKDGFIQFGDQMQKYERLFQRYYKGGDEFDEKTQNALEKLESIIQNKLQKGEIPVEQKIPSKPIPSTPVQENQPE